MLLNNQQITNNIKKKIKICIETNENENTTTKTLWDLVKAVLRGRFIAIQTYLKKAQAGIRIARRNISNLRYADDTTLMAESEEELKSLDESERGE